MPEEEISHPATIEQQTVYKREGENTLDIHKLHENSQKTVIIYSHDTHGKREYHVYSLLSKLISTCMKMINREVRTT